MELAWLILGVFSLSVAAKHDGASSSKTSAAVDRDEAQRKKIERAIHSVKEKLGDNITLSRLLHVLATRRLLHDIKKRKKNKKTAGQKKRRLKHATNFELPELDEQSSTDRRTGTRKISSRVKEFKLVPGSSLLKPKPHELLDTGLWIRNKTRPARIHVRERKIKDNGFWKNSTVTQGSEFAESSALGYLHHLPRNGKLLNKKNNAGLSPETNVAEDNEFSGFNYNGEDLHEDGYGANKPHHVFEAFGEVPRWYQFDKKRKDYIPRPPTKTEPAKKKSSFSFPDSDVSSQIMNTENSPLFDLLETIDASDAKQIADLMRKEQSPEIVTTDLAKEIPSIAREGENLDIFTGKSAAYYNVPVRGKNIRPRERDSNNAEITEDVENLENLLDNAMQRQKLQRDSDKLIRKEGELQKLRKVLAKSNEALAAKIKQKQKLLKMLELGPIPEQDISTIKGQVGQGKKPSPKIGKVNRPGVKASRLASYQQNMPVVFTSRGKEDAKTASLLLMSALDSAGPIGPIQKEPHIENEPNSITMVDASGRPRSRNKPVINSSMALKKAQSALKASLKFVKHGGDQNPFMKKIGSLPLLGKNKNANKRLQSSRNFQKPFTASVASKQHYIQQQARVGLKLQQNTKGRRPQNLALSHPNAKQHPVSTTAKTKAVMKTTEKPGPEMEEGRNGLLLSPKDVTGIRKTTGSFIGKVAQLPLGKVYSSEKGSVRGGPVAMQRPLPSPIRKPNSKGLRQNHAYTLFAHNSLGAHQERQNGYSKEYPIGASDGALAMNRQRYFSPRAAGTRSAQLIDVVKAHEHPYSLSGRELHAFPNQGHISATANSESKRLGFDNGIRKEALPTPTLPTKQSTLRPGSWKVRDYYLPGNDKSSWEKAQSLWTTQNGNMFRFDNAIAYHPNDGNKAASPMVSVVNGPPIPTMPLLATGMFRTPHMVPQMNEGLQEWPMMPTMSPVYGPTPMTMPPWQWFKDHKNAPRPSLPTGTRSTTHRKPTTRQQPVQTTARELSPTKPTSFLLATSQSTTSQNSQGSNATLSVSLPKKTKNGSKIENDTESGLAFGGQNQASVLQSNATANGSSGGDNGHTEGLVSGNSTKVVSISPESWKGGDIQNLYFDNASYPNTTASKFRDSSKAGALFTIDSKQPIVDGKNKPSSLLDKTMSAEAQGKESPGMSPGDMQNNHPEQTNKKNNSENEDRSNLLSYELVGLTNDQRQNSLPQFPSGSKTINTNGVTKDKVYHADYYGQRKPWGLVNKSPGSLRTDEPDERRYESLGVGDERSKTRSFENMAPEGSSRRDLPLRGGAGGVFPISEDEELPDLPAIPTDAPSPAPFARKPVTSPWPKVLPHLEAPTISSNARATKNVMETIRLEKTSSLYSNPLVAKELTARHNAYPLPQLQKGMPKGSKDAIASYGRALSSVPDKEQRFYHKAPKFREYGSINGDDYANSYVEGKANTFKMKEKEGYVSQAVRNRYKENSYQFQSGFVKHEMKRPLILAAQRKIENQREAAKRLRLMYHLMKTKVIAGDAKANIPSEGLYNRYESGVTEASALDKAYIPSTLKNENSESGSPTLVHRYMSMNTHGPSLRFNFMPDKEGFKAHSEHSYQQPESRALQGNLPNTVKVNTPPLQSSLEASLSKEAIDTPQSAAPILRGHYGYKSADRDVSFAPLGSQSERLRTQQVDPAQVALARIPNSQRLDHYVGDTSTQESKMRSPHRLLRNLASVVPSRKLLRDVDSDAVPSDDILTEPIPFKPDSRPWERQQQYPEYENTPDLGSAVNGATAFPQTLEFPSPRSSPISSSNSSSVVENPKLTKLTAQGQNSVSNLYSSSASNPDIIQEGANNSRGGVTNTTSSELQPSSPILKVNTESLLSPLVRPLAGLPQLSHYPSPPSPLQSTSLLQPLVPQYQPYTANQSSTNGSPYWLPAPPVANSSQTNPSPTLHATYPPTPPPKVHLLSPVPPPPSPPSPPPSPSISIPAPLPGDHLPLVRPPQAVPPLPPVQARLFPDLPPILSPTSSTTPSIPPPPAPAYIVPPSPAVNMQYLPYQPPKVSQISPPAPPSAPSYLPPAPPPPYPPMEASTTPTSPPLQSYVTTTVSSQLFLRPKGASTTAMIPLAPLASPGSLVPAQTRSRTMTTTPVLFYRQLPLSTTPIPAQPQNSSASDTMYPSAITMTSIPVVQIPSVQVAPPILRQKNSFQASKSQIGDVTGNTYTANSAPARSTTDLNAFPADQSQTQRQQELLGSKTSPVQSRMDDPRNNSNAQTLTWRLATVRPTEKTTAKHPGVDGVNLTWDSASSFLPKSMESPDKISLYVPLPETMSQVNQSPNLSSESHPASSSPSESPVLPNTTAKAPILSIEVHEPIENEDLIHSNETTHFVNAVVSKEKGFQQFGDNPESALSEDDHNSSKKSPEATKALSIDQLAAGIEALGPTGPFSQNNSDPNEVKYGSEKFYVSAPVYNVRTAKNQSPEDAGDELNLNDMYWTDSAEEKESICKEQKGTNAVSHVLCFGDSLTRGYYNKGKNHHPYTNKLQFLLNKLDTKKCYIVDNEGKDGDLASGEMPRRLTRVFNQSQVKYDWAIILGGTNDIYNKRSTAPRSAEQIFENIVSLHEIAHDRGTKSVAVTIPEVNCDATETCEDVKQVREEVNEKLRKYAYTHRNAIVLSDLSGKLQRSKLDQVLIGQFFEGGLHLRPRGYERMALIIFEDLKRALS